MMNKKTFFNYATVIGCNVLWGVLGIFWDVLSNADSIYILAQRILWSAIFMGIILLLRGKAHEIAAALRDKKNLTINALCGVLITVNWGTYIYSVGIGRTLDSSLGYFMSPIATVVIGMIVFKERPRRLETITIIIACIGILYFLFRSSTIPILALLIATSFPIYGALKKKLSLSSELALFLETICMSPLALSYIVWSHVSGSPVAGLDTWQILMIPITGIATSLPLLLYGIGVRHVPYYLSGILLYLNPTLQFLVGLFYFGETLDLTRLITFIIIWFGILFTIIDKLLLKKKETAASQQ